MQDEFLKMKGKTTEDISSADDVLSVFPSHVQEYSPRRVDKKIFARLIYTSERGEILSREDTQMLRETRFVSKNELPISIDMTIYDDKIAISALKGKISGIIVEHREIADSFRAIFNLLWGKLK